jgi:excisionase family DNA binding protein
MFETPQWPVMQDKGRLLVTIDEAAIMLSTSRQTIYRMIRNGEIRTIRLGARQRIRVDDLRMWIEGTASVATER